MNPKYALVGSADKIARLWDVASGQEVRRFTGHTDVVNAVAFAADGKRDVTGRAETTRRYLRVDQQDVTRLACAALLRDLTPEERATYGIADDAPTCPKP